MKSQFKVGQVAWDLSNKCYVKVEGRNDPYVELRYWDVLHVTGNSGERYAAGLDQLRPLTKRECGH